VQQWNDRLFHQLPRKLATLDYTDKGETTFP